MTDVETREELRATVRRWVEREVLPVAGDDDGTAFIVMELVEGETLESIASLVNCSVSTVQRRLRAAEAFMERLK